MSEPLFISTSMLISDRGQRLHAATEPRSPTSAAAAEFETALSPFLPRCYYYLLVASLAVVKEKPALRPVIRIPNRFWHISRCCPAPSWSNCHKVSRMYQSFRLGQCDRSGGYSTGRLLVATSTRPTQYRECQYPAPRHQSPLAPMSSN